MSEKLFFTFLKSWLLVFIFAAALGTEKAAEPSVLNPIAEGYVKLVLKVGLHDPDYVDAYYGPAEWRPAPSLKADSFPLSQLQQETEDLLKKLSRVNTDLLSELERMRCQFLVKQLEAVQAKVELLAGKKMSFDQESQVLYDAVAPRRPRPDMEKILTQLDRLLPGKGTVGERFYEFQNRLVVPSKKLAEAFQAAISECRRRTLAHIPLPKDENFTAEYVTHQPWGAYNWYQGNHFSLIQINTDMPIAINRIVALAGHEGYPGHHVYNVLLEDNLLKDKGWIEFSVYPLYSPQSLIAEGTANYGIELIFPGNEQQEFEKKVLCPLAELDPDLVDQNAQIRALLGALRYGQLEIQRDFLDGRINRQQALAELRHLDLVPSARADHRLDFLTRYRSYVINYSLGHDLIKEFIEKKCQSSDSDQIRWYWFKKILTEPYIPSSLK